MTGTTVALAAAYLTVGFYCGLVAAWEATAYRPNMPRPTLDVAIGTVVLFVTVTWPVWVIGYSLWRLQTRRRRAKRPSPPRWLNPQAWAGAGVLVLVAAVLWESQ